MTCWGAPILPAAERVERDAQRLDAIRAAQRDASDRVGQAEQRRSRQLEARRRALDELSTLDAQNTTLDAQARRLGDDLSQVDALVRSALQAHRRRLEGGPIGVDRPALGTNAAQLLQAPASLDNLYEAWFALHTEWVATSEVVRSDQAVTRRDGDRQVVPVLRVGGTGLLFDARELTIDAVAGLLEAPDAQPPATVGREFLAQQIYDSGAIGVALLGCALAGMVIVLRRLLAAVFGIGAPGVRYGSLTLIASASMLLGLLGTVVGLIQTFRGLAQFGGSQVSVAAAGISHALATTWMGLVIAIPLMLAQGMLRTVTPVRIPGETARLPSSRRGAGLWGRLAVGVGLASALAFGLFFLMQWLTQRPLAEPAQRETAVTVARVDWKTPPPPPPPPPTVVPVTDVPVAATTTTLSLPSIEPLAAPAARLDLPALDLGDRVGLSIGDGATIGAGTLWSGASGGEQIIDGSDLVPISSARPGYPRDAFDAGVEGWVEAIFEIDAGGRVSNVRIIDADPPGVFEQAAASALQRWLYAPFYRDGKPVAREATQLLRFRLDEVRDSDLLESP